jgi:hypothetical protein
VDSYLGGNQIGHVMIIWSRANKTTEHTTLAPASETSASQRAHATTSSKSG